MWRTGSQCESERERAGVMWQTEVFVRPPEQEYSGHADFDLGRISRKENGFNQDQKNLAHFFSQSSVSVRVNYIPPAKILILLFQNFHSPCSSSPCAAATRLGHCLESDACAAPLAFHPTEDSVQAVLGGVQVSSQHGADILNEISACPSRFLRIVLTSDRPQPMTFAFHRQRLWLMWRLFLKGALQISH